MTISAGHHHILEHPTLLLACGAMETSEHATEGRVRLFVVENAGRGKLCYKAWMQCV